MATFDHEEGEEMMAATPAIAEAIPRLHEGQTLDQPTFHEIYARMPEDFRAELIDGVVYLMNMPIYEGHGRPFNEMGTILYLYSMDTPGTSSLNDTTTTLGPRGEVQPDCSLRIDAEYGGRARVDPGGMIVGCPELVVEIASSSLRVDLNAKKRAYEEAGALEYLVYDVPHQKFHWFALREGRFEPMAIDPDGIFRSQAFPGLWLDAAASLAGDKRAVVAALRRGLDSPEHAEFVDRLRRQKAERP